MPRWMRGHCRWRGRPQVDIRRGLSLEELMYIPVKTVVGLEPSNYVEIYDYEVEALKLVHLDNLSTDEAASRMGISKTTFWRILESCRAKLAEALVSSKPIKLVSIPKSSSESS